jgi:Uma2 family endonuclease
LVVEVAASGPAPFDRHTRSGIYRGAGVSEVWLVDPQRQVVEVQSYVSGWRLRHYQDDEELVSDLLPGFRLALEGVWRGSCSLPLGVTRLLDL